MRHIYIDHAATTALDPEVLEAMRPYFTEIFGNASSLHSFGREARMTVENARKQVAAILGAKSNDILFTAGGTESDNIAIKGIAYYKKKGHIITSMIEHPAVLETCRYLEKIGFSVTYVPVGHDGIVDVGDVERALRPDTIIISIMHANNEIGTIQPIAELGKLAHEHGILFHTDAVQSIGKLEIDVEKMNIDMLSLSGHKIYGPKGIGALYVRADIKLEPFIHGGGHERGLRSSTENVPGIVGLAKALELAKERFEHDVSHMKRLRDKLIRGVLENIEEAYLNGHPTLRLPNNAHFRFTGIEGESLILGLDEYGIAASTGSACSSKKLEPSHVLRAIGLSEVEAHGSLRLTLGRKNTDEDINYVLEVLPQVLKRLRAMSPLWKR